MWACNPPECCKGQLVEARWKLQQWRPDLDRELFEEEIVPRTPRMPEVPQLLTAMSPRKEAESPRSSSPSSPRKLYGRDRSHNGRTDLPMRTPEAVRKASPRARRAPENLFPPGMFKEVVFEAEAQKAEGSEEEVQAPRRDSSRIKDLNTLQFGDFAAEPSFVDEPGFDDDDFLHIVPDVEEENPPDRWEPPPESSAVPPTKHLDSVHPHATRKHGRLWEEMDINRNLGLPEEESKEFSDALRAQFVHPKRKSGWSLQQKEARRRPPAFLLLDAFQDVGSFVGRSVGSIMLGLQDILESVSPSKHLDQKLEAPVEEKLEAPIKEMEAPLTPVFLVAEEEARRKAKLFNDEMEQRMQGLKKKVQDFSTITSEAAEAAEAQQAMQRSPGAFQDDQDDAKAEKFARDMDKRLAELKEAYNGPRSRSQSPSLIEMARLQQRTSGTSPDGSAKAIWKVSSRDPSPMSAKRTRFAEDTETGDASRAGRASKAGRGRSPVPKLRLDAMQSGKAEPLSETVKGALEPPALELSSEDEDPEGSKEEHVHKLKTVQTANKKPVTGQSQRSRSTSPAPPTDSASGDASRKLSMSAVLADLESAELKIHGEAFKNIFDEGKESLAERMQEHLMMHSEITEEQLKESTLMKELPFAMDEVQLEESAAFKGFMQILQELPVATEPAIKIFEKLSITGGAMPLDRCQQQAQTELEIKFSTGYTWFRWDALLDSAFDGAGKKLNQDKWIRHYKRAARMVRLFQLLKL